MKKTLVALAALAATSAFAQSSVTAYGVIDTGWYSSKANYGAAGTDRGTVKNTGLQNSTLAGSRLGFKGTEDMGKGLKANFVAEMALNAIGDQFGSKTDGAGAPSANKTTDAAAAAPFNRATWAGLSGGFGEVRAGYGTTTQYDHNGLYTAGFEGAAGARNHLDVLAAGILPSQVANIETNRIVGVTYFTPSMNGVTGSVQWGRLKQDIDSTMVTTLGSQTVGGVNTAASLAAAKVGLDIQHSSLGLNYANGPLTAGGVYSTVTSTVNAGLISGGNEVKSSGGVYGAAYDLGVAKMFAYYGDRKTTQSGAQDVKVNTVRVGAHVPVGNTKLIASYGTLTGKQNGAEVSDRKFYQVGALHSLSKRTTVFALYGSDKDDQSLAGYNGNAAGLKGTTDLGTRTLYNADITTVRIGLNHAF